MFSLASLFGHTRLLELRVEELADELKREREAREADRRRHEIERQALTEALARRNGISHVFTAPPIKEKASTSVAFTPAQANERERLRREEEARTKATANEARREFRSLLSDEQKQSALEAARSREVTG